MITTIREKKIIKQLYYEKRYSYADIGRIYNISRQRVHQIVKEYKSFATHNFSFANIPINSNICIKCGEKSEDIHHIDKNSKNNNIRNLITLCKKCHREMHLLLKRKRKILP